MQKDNTEENSIIENRKNCARKKRPIVDDLNFNTEADLENLIKKSYVKLNFDIILIMNETFFTEFLGNDFYRAELQTYRSDDYGTLIHVCCEANKPQYIKALIHNIGCEIQRQNNRGQTALHLAIKLNYDNCIDTILCIFEQNIIAKDETSKLYLQFYEMLKAYTHRGYTVIHESVIQNSTKTLQRLLNMCNKMEINVLENEVLGGGESLLHLALKTNNETNINCIIQQVPDVLYKTDYSGEYCYQTIGITKKIQLYLLECVMGLKDIAMLNQILRFYTMYKKDDTKKFRNKVIGSTLQSEQLNSTDLLAFMVKATELDESKNDSVGLVSNLLKKYIKIISK